MQAAGTGSLSGAVSTTPGAVNLTTLGTADWVQFGVGQVVPGIVRKASGGSQISGYSIVGAGPAKPYNDDLRTTSWSDGTPTATGSTNRSGVYIDAVGNGYSITVPAGTASRTVTMLVGGWESGGTLRAHLGDSSAADYVNTSATVSAATTASTPSPMRQPPPRRSR